MKLHSITELSFITLILHSVFKPKKNAILPIQLIDDNKYHRGTRPQIPNPQADINCQLLGKLFYNDRIILQRSKLNHITPHSSFLLLLHSVSRDTNTFTSFGAFQSQTLDTRLSLIHPNFHFCKSYFGEHCASLFILSHYQIGGSG